MNKDQGKKLISIVCPLLNECKAVPLFYMRLKKVLEELGDYYDFELLFTNNRSTDSTLEEIRKLRKQDQTVQVLTFSRNFGYQASILAGVTYAAGDGIVIIDVDCEDPPEMIPQFIAKWEEGYDLVYGIRGKRPEPRPVTFMRKIFYRLLRFTSDSDIIMDMAEFSLFSRRVRDEIIRNNNTFPFLRAEIAYSGFKKYGIKYDRQKRIVGNTHYNFWGMVLFAVAGILTVSTFPLRLAVYLLPFVFLVNMTAFLLTHLWSLHLFFQAAVIFDLTYISFLLTAQGMYIARIYKNVIKRPVFIVDWELSELNHKSEGSSNLSLLSPPRNNVI